MSIELENYTSDTGEMLREPTPLQLESRASGALPIGMVLVEAAAASLREWLDSHELQDWQIFHADLPLADIERHAGDPDAPGVWHDLPALSGGVAMHRVTTVNDTLQHSRSGLLLFERAGVGIARWYWVDPAYNTREILTLIASPGLDRIQNAMRMVRERQHLAHGATWQILRGYQTDESQPARPRIARESIFLTKRLEERIDREVIGFFDSRAEAMYRSLNVPYRRGVLMHGPPGNGKTSTIRYIGGALPNVSALILRPYANFDQDDLEAAIATWTRQAPAMLIIEDLNWLLQRIEVSGFLNLLDGIDTPNARGLLLIASTNHPDKLDPAINNRPGRFDIVIEMGLPRAKQRLAYFTRFLAGLDEATLATLVERSEGLSFAHLGEVHRVAGLTAIHEGRSERTGEDLVKALELVKAAHVSADRGFAGPPPAFGLQSRHRQEADDEE